MKVFLIADPDTERFIEKMRGVEQDVARREGAFSLFSLLERADTPGQWDVVAAAPWLNTERNSILKITRAITARLSPEEALHVARVVPLPSDSDFGAALQNIHEGPSDADGPLIMLGRSVLSGVEINRGYILASSPGRIARRAVEDTPSLRGERAGTVELAA